MSYLTYSKEFQNNVINAKKSGTEVSNIVEKFNISIYTLYKILHMNGEMPTPSQASEGISSEEGVEHRNLSPNNNDSQERSASTWNYNSCRHKKVEHICLNCEGVFMARNRGSRTKFCSKKCKSNYQTKTNSTIKICPCGNEFRVKNSIAKAYVFCKNCRRKNLRYPTSVMAMNIVKWLEESELSAQKEKYLNGFMTRINLKVGLDWTPFYQIITLVLNMMVNSTLNHVLLLIKSLSKKLNIETSLKQNFVMRTI